VAPIIDLPPPLGTIEPKDRSNRLFLDASDGYTPSYGLVHPTPIEGYTPTKGTFFNGDRLPIRQPTANRHRANYQSPGCHTPTDTLPEQGDKSQTNMGDQINPFLARQQARMYPQIIGRIKTGRTSNYYIFVHREIGEPWQLSEAHSFRMVHFKATDFPQLYRHLRREGATWTPLSDEENEHRSLLTSGIPLSAFRSAFLDLQFYHITHTVRHY